jgi:uncharacterized membrane protein SpoIIM required for sporulation
MREAAFIKQNKEKWLEFERAISGETKKNPDEWAALYVQIVSDLSFSQTYYPKSKTVIYLNHLASQIFQKIYKTRRHETNRVVHFFKTEVPLLTYQNRRYLLYSFLLLLLFTAIGVLSEYGGDGLARRMLGDEYVNKTLENIREGNPTAVYSSGSNWGSFIGIVFNNLKVGAFLYASGIFGGIGSFYALLQNGVMLGCFHYIFATQDVLYKSALGIWIHGSFEIFSMVVEGGCGLMLGASLLFPRTYSRIDSLKIGFRNSFKIFLSTMPFTIAAAVLEGFVTRYANGLPDVVNLAIILSTLSIISYYYIIYPYRVARRMQNEQHAS